MSMECKGNILSVPRDLDMGGIVVNLCLKDVSVQELQTAKVLGISTKTSEEIENMKSLWKATGRKKSELYSRDKSIL